jgi:hypothetical protein
MLSQMIPVQNTPHSPRVSKIDFEERKEEEGQHIHHKVFPMDSFSLAFPPITFTQLSSPHNNNNNNNNKTKLNSVA